MFTPSSAAVRAFTRVSSTFTPAAVRTFFRFSSFTGLPAACRTNAPYTYSICRHLLAFDHPVVVRIASSAAPGARATRASI